MFETMGFSFLFLYVLSVKWWVMYNKIINLPYNFHSQQRTLWCNKIEAKMHLFLMWRRDNISRNCFLANCNKFVKKWPTYYTIIMNASHNSGQLYPFDFHFLHFVCASVWEREERRKKFVIIKITNDLYSWLTTANKEAA